MERILHSRKPEVGNDGWLVEGETSSADGEKGPTKEEQPDSLVFQSCNELR